MHETREQRLSSLVRAYAAGDSGAFDELVTLLHGELRGMAGRLSPDGRHTLQPTALVNETVLRLLQGRTELRDERHLLAVAARAMRGVLADHARRRATFKRGGAYARVTLDAELLPARAGDVDLAALDDALRALERVDPRQARIVELRYFGGLENREIAELVELSVRTVELDLAMARGFLRRRLESAT